MSAASKKPLTGSGELQGRYRLFEMAQPEGGKGLVLRKAPQHGRTAVSRGFYAVAPALGIVAGHVLLSVPSDDGQQRQQPYPGGGEARQQRIQIIFPVHDADMNMGIQLPDGRIQRKIAGRGRMTRPVPHENDIFLRFSFGRQMTRHSVRRTQNIIFGVQQRHAQTYPKTGAVRFLGGKANLRIFRAANGLQGLHGHGREIFKAQTLQGLGDGIAFLSGLGKAPAHEQGRIGPAHGQTGEHPPHPGVKGSQSGSALRTARAVGNKKYGAPHGAFVRQLSRRRKALRIDRASRGG